MKLRLVTIAVTAALAVTACSNSGYGDRGGSVQPPGANQTPTVGSISNQSINQDTPTNALSFTVADDGGPDSLTLSATSSNGDVVSPDNVSFSGTGANRTLTVTPSEDATGTAAITVNAKDAQGAMGTSTFNISVAAVSRSILSYTTSAFALGENDMPVQVSGFTFVQDADDDTTFDSLLQ